MKTTLIAVMLGIFAIVMPTTSQAADIEVGADLAFNLPMSDWGDGSGIGFGGWGKGGYALNEDMGLNFRVGYLLHLEKDSIPATSILPLLLGFKYNLPANLSVEVAVGGNYLMNEVENEFKFGFLGAVGYEIADILIGANFYAPSFGDMGEMWSLLFTAGYHFAL
jgi:hypothetical protein